MRKGLIVIAGIVVLVLGVIVFYWYENQQAGDTAPLEVTLEVAPGPAAAPELEQAAPPLVVGEKLSVVDQELEELPLPPLAQSDTYVQENLAGVIGEAAVMQYFANEGLVSRAVATLDALGSRQVPGNIQAVQGPAGIYAAAEDTNPPTVILNEQGEPVPQYLSDPANQSRYISYVEMLETMDVETFSALYQRNYPLFQQAWRELGYVDVDFNERLGQVIDELLATPDPDEPYRLVKPEAVYLFADEDLESLTAGQKVLLRMGSENAKRVKSSLRQIQQALQEI